MTSELKRSPDRRNMTLSHNLLAVLGLMAEGKSLGASCREVGINSASVWQALRFRPYLRPLFDAVYRSKPISRDIVYTEERLNEFFARVEGGMTVIEAVKDMPFSHHGVKYRLRRKPTELRRYQRAVAVRSLRNVDLLREVSDMVPTNMPDRVRNEVIQLMCLRVLEGEVPLGKIRKYLPQIKREFWEGEPRTFGHVSFDATYDNRLSLHETLSSGEQ